MSAIVKLSRWRQHVPYTLPLVLIGALMATDQTEISLDWRLLSVTLANVLAMTFAFMINDVVDAPDDARDPIKRQSNIISQGRLSLRDAVIASGVVLMSSALLFVLGGVWPFLTGMGTLILSLLYSVSPIRLKARPIVDVVSHVLMLSALIMLSGYMIYSTSISNSWWVILGVTFASAYGQFYNQLDDFETDQQARLNNTAMLIGEANTQHAIVICAALTVICFAGAILTGVFPGWLGWVLAITMLTVGLFRWDVDMRGNAADSSGAVQRPVLLTANIVAFIWLLSALNLIGIG